MQGLTERRPARGDLTTADPCFQRRCPRPAPDIPARNQQGTVASSGPVTFEGHRQAGHTREEKAKMGGAPHPSWGALGR